MSKKPRNPEQAMLGAENYGSRDRKGDRKRDREATRIFKRGGFRGLERDEDKTPAPSRAPGSEEGIRKNKMVDEARQELARLFDIQKKAGATGKRVNGLAELINAEADKLKEGRGTQDVQAEIAAIEAEVKRVKGAPKTQERRSGSEEGADKREEIERTVNYLKDALFQNWMLALPGIKKGEDNGELRKSRQRIAQKLMGLGLTKSEVDDANEEAQRRAEELLPRFEAFKSLREAAIQAEKNRLQKYNPETGKNDPDVLAAAQIAEQAFFDFLRGVRPSEVIDADIRDEAERMIASGVIDERKELQRKIEEQKPKKAAPPSRGTAKKEKATEGEPLSDADLKRIEGEFYSAQKEFIGGNLQKKVPDLELLARIKTLKARISSHFQATSKNRGEAPQATAKFIGGIVAKVKKELSPQPARAPVPPKPKAGVAPGAKPPTAKERSDRAEIARFKQEMASLSPEQKSALADYLKLELYNTIVYHRPDSWPKDKAGFSDRVVPNKIINELKIKLSVLGLTDEEINRLSTNAFSEREEFVKANLDESQRIEKSKEFWAKFKERLGEQPLFPEEKKPENFLNPEELRVAESELFLAEETIQRELEDAKKTGRAPDPSIMAQAGTASTNLKSKILNHFIASGFSREVALQKVDEIVGSTMAGVKKKLGLPIVPEPGAPEGKRLSPEEISDIEREYMQSIINLENLGLRREEEGVGKTELELDQQLLDLEQKIYGHFLAANRGNKKAARELTNNKIENLQKGAEERKERVERELRAAPAGAKIGAEEPSAAPEPAPVKREEQQFQEELFRAAMEYRQARARRNMPGISDEAIRYAEKQIVLSRQRLKALGLSENAIQKLENTRLSNKRIRGIVGIAAREIWKRREPAPSEPAAVETPPSAPETPEEKTQKQIENAIAEATEQVKESLRKKLEAAILEDPDFSESSPDEKKAIIGVLIRPQLKKLAPEIEKRVRAKFQ